jgi:lipopolysaccharide/colanic/teichoic acid biosynthesis glycosyltransferase
MSDRRDNNGNLLPDEQRLNTYGTFLRKTSLDEIPQIFNIFKGDLSIVGPRPLLVAYLNYYTEMELIRHTVKPGLTGLAQINGGNTIKWEQRLKYDIQYVHNQSFVLDVKIFLRTIFHLFRRQTLHYSASLIEERSGKGFSFSTSLLQ